MENETIKKEITTNTIRLIFALILASIMGASAAFVKTRVLEERVESNKDTLIQIRDSVIRLEEHLIN